MEMSSEPTNIGDGRESGRRFFTRADSGRRTDDRAQTEFLPETETSSPEPRATQFSYLFLLFAILVIGVVSVRTANTRLAPLLYDEQKITEVAGYLHGSRSYFTFDLNINTRILRREHIRRLEEAPEVAVMGASHWQEASGALMPSVDFYNAHVHRDYYEDIVAVLSWFVRYDKLPEKIILSIRDNQFTPVSDRTDYLWVPALPDYRAGASLLGLENHNAYANGLTPQLSEMMSLRLLWSNLWRYMSAQEQPHAAEGMLHPTLDALLPDGSINWSAAHRESFTPAATYASALSLAEEKRNTPPGIDSAGVAAVDAVLEYLVEHGVVVYIAHPPFNPDFWNAVQGTPYLEGLRHVERIVAEMAAKHGIEIIGGFNPYEVGCTVEMYIDGEHSSPRCLGRILNQFLTREEQKAPRPEGVDQT